MFHNMSYANRISTPSAVEGEHRLIGSDAGAFVLSLLFATAAPAAQCGGDFSAFIAAMSREAAAAGISRAVSKRLIMLL